MSVFSKIQAGEYDTKITYSKETIKEYNNDVTRLEQKLHEDLANEYHMEMNSIEQKVWECAWMEGHSCGYAEVANYYIDFMNKTEEELDDIL